MTLYVATINIPGYLPMDDEPPVFDNTRDAWQYLIEEIDLAWDEFPEGDWVEAHTAMHAQNQTVTGTVYASTPDGTLAYSVSVAE